jgi:thioredoxin reductase
MDQINEVTIIGAGPAGIAAAIYLKRAGLYPILLEKNEPGGLLRNAHLVENYPGFPKGISGLNLIHLFRKHLEEASVTVFPEEVIKLDIEDGTFLIQTQKRVFPSRIVVIGTGTKPREFTSFQMSKEVKDKIFYEVYPLLKLRRKTVVIIGVGDAAFDYALHLEKNNRVVILNRGQQARCIPILWERAVNSPRITYCKNTELVGITCDSSDRMLLECRGPQGRVKLDADYVLFAVGREPQLDFLSEKLKMNVQESELKGSIYFVGDVKNVAFRQTAIAVGDGVMTAMKIIERLKEMSL